MTHEEYLTEKTLVATYLKSSLETKINETVHVYIGSDTADITVLADGKTDFYMQIASLSKIIKLGLVNLKTLDMIVEEFYERYYDHILKKFFK